MMNITLVEFKDLMKSINQEFEEYYRGNDTQVILDGCLNYELYYYSNIKVVWLMKEAYDSDGGGWDFGGAFFDNDVYYDKLVVGGSRATWQPVVYIMASICNEFKEYNGSAISREMAKNLKKIAWLNIQKLPSKNGTNTNMDDIYSAFNGNKELLFKQLNSLQPNIVICANTFQVIHNKLPIHKKTYVDDSLGYTLIDNVLYIDAYHPAQRKISRNKYVNDIIRLIKAHYHKRI